MTILGLDHQYQVVITILLIVCLFAFLARIDYVMVERESMKNVNYRLGVITIDSNWFWLWCVGYPLFGIIISLTYLFGASDTERNMWYAFGLFATVLLLAFGQLEDFFYHVINPEISWIPIDQDWTYNGWNAENSLVWKLFGEWNSLYHWVWLSMFVAIVIVMWYIIFKYA